MLVLISILVATAALFGWVSARVLKLPNTIGTMLLTAIGSLSLVLLSGIWPEPHEWAVAQIQQISFDRLILHGMLSVLLFAGAFLLDLRGLKQQQVPVGLLAVFSTLISIVGVGAITFYTARFFGYSPSPIASLLFGALISPTDPIAVLEMLHRVQTPKYIESQLAGESLFNDGVGAVVFLALLEAMRGSAPTFPHIGLEILLAGGGGILLGAVLAVPIAMLMRTVKSAPIDILLSLALALGGYAIADHMGISAPLETVAAALVLRLLIDNQPEERVANRDLNHFWKVVDEIQNAILFVLLGCEFLLIAFERNAVFLGFSEIVIVNLLRVTSVGIVLLLLKMIQPKQKSSLAVLSWGGLRGGLSIALAISIPREFGLSWVVTSTYVVVAFSILVQGGTMGAFLKRRRSSGEPKPLSDL
ncbi:MAG: sodium:proton antiporter [Acidobacteria bacterium]|nr:sodium:proton antiporter [Acidobacteriota bacterium]